MGTPARARRRAEGEHTGQGRASVPRDQDSVPTKEGLTQGIGQENDGVVQPVQPGEPSNSEEFALGLVREVCPEGCRAASDGMQSTESQAIKMTSLCANSTAIAPGLLIHYPVGPPLPHVKPSGEQYFLSLFPEAVSVC